MAGIKEAKWGKKEQREKRTESNEVKQVPLTAKEGELNHVSDAPRQLSVSTTLSELDLRRKEEERVRVSTREVFFKKK